MKNFDYQFNDSLIHQRQSDGYVNLTEMAKSEGSSKMLADYLRLETTKLHRDKVASSTGIPISQVFDVRKGRKYDSQGTWAHPAMVKHFTEWLKKPRYSSVDKGYLYVYLDPGNDAFKVGFTKNMATRTKQHKTSNPFLELIKVYEVTAIEAEVQVHSQLKAYRIKGTTEWYKKSTRVLSIITIAVKPFLNKA